MPAYDLAHYEWLRAYLDGDLEGVLQAARRRSDLEGGLAVVQATMRLNRLDEAFGLMEKRITAPVNLKNVVLWEFWTQILHERGDHRRELAEARRGLANIRPTGSQDAVAHAMTFEIRALASLGHSAEVKSRLEELHELQPTNEAFASAARELRWHGYPDAATEVGRLAAQWYQETVRQSPTRRTKILLGRSLGELGEWDRARSIFQELAAESLVETFTPDQVPGFDLAPLGYLGIDAARRGDTLAAEGMIDRLGRLTRPYRHGAHIYWQARIAAELGSCERAVGFLRKAQQAGESVYDANRYELQLEVAEFRRLTDCAAYQRFIAPKG
jgi:tetratricopeptide (TPR) repeat protein